MAKHPIGLDDRSRNKNGRIRKKRDDTRVDTMRQEIPDFAPGYRGDAHIGTVFKASGVETLDQYLSLPHNKRYLKGK
jgi:hypothetical protein